MFQLNLISFLQYLPFAINLSFLRKCFHAMLLFCLVGAMFNTKYKISVSTILPKNELYRFIHISHSNISIFLYRRYINGNTSTNHYATHCAVFFQSLLNSSLLGPNIFLSTLFSIILSRALPSGSETKFHTHIKQ